MRRYLCLISLILIWTLFQLSGCQSPDPGTASSDSAGEQDLPPRTTVTDILLPSADGTLTYGNDFVTIDASHLSDGYVMVKYAGPADSARLQLTLPDGSLYSYYLAPGDYQTFPLSGGSGSYHLEVYEHAYDSKYALLWPQDLTAELTDEFHPFLYPNQYCSYTRDSRAVDCGISLSEKSASDLDYVNRVYLYVTETIVYDDVLGANIPTDYIPDLDAVLTSGTGICFDYASLMTAMLRSQGIPTKLEVGYSGQTYHAWISVYLTESGWVDHIISFDGQNWTLLDPTLAASNDRKDVEKYIGDGTHYTVKYHY